MIKKINLFFLSILSLSLVSAQNVDLVGSAKGLFGGFSIGSAWNILSYGIIALVVFGAIAFFVKDWMMKKKFNKSITFWKRNPLTGLTVADRTVKAMTVRLDSYGNLGYRLQRPYETKNLIPKLKYEAKTNVHYVEFCEDGRLVEMVGIIGYDEKRKAMNMAFSDHNTELARSSMHQMNKERYEKQNFWKENATLLVNIGAIVVIMVFLWLIADKLIEIVSSVSGVVQEAGKLQEAQANIIDSLNRILQQNSIPTEPIN